MKLHYTLSALSLVAMLAAAPSAMAANATAGVGAAVGTTTSGTTATAGTNGGVAATTDGTTVSTDTSANGNVSADNGVSALGVNISTAGDTATSVQSFTTNLTTEQQANVVAGCKAAMAHPDKASADVLAFCKNSMM